MQTHLSGPIQGSRQGAVVVRQSFSLDFTNNLTAVNLKLCTIKASTTQPVVIRAKAIVLTADNSGTTATLSLGTASGGTQLLNAVDIKATAGTNYIPTNTETVLVADTDIYAVKTLVGTAATAGQVIVFLDIAEININQPTTQGE